MNADGERDDGPNNKPKSRSNPEFLGLSRCAGCYNHRANTAHWRGGDGESSSSAEDSGPEVDLESEPESSSSSCSSSGKVSSPEEPEEEEEPSHGDGGEEAAASPGDQRRAASATQRAPLIKSFSLPASFTPHLTPLALLPRPHTVVSTLNLQVLSQKHDDAFHIIKRGEPTRTHPAGDGLLPWQRLQHQHQQHYPPPPPPAAQGQRLPLPVFHPPAHEFAPQPCWVCYSMQLPPYWRHCSGAHVPR